MTIKDGEEMNKNFKLLKDSVLHYKNLSDSGKKHLNEYMLFNGQALQRMYTSYEAERNKAIQKDYELAASEKAYKRSVLAGALTNLILFALLAVYVGK